MSANSLRHYARRHPRVAFTLIEVLVAMTILAAGILGVMGAFSLCIQANSRAFRQKEAAVLAEKYLGVALAERTKNSDDVSGTEGQYAWAVSFRDVDEGLMLAQAVVTWSQRGVPQTFALSRVVVPQEEN